MALSSMLRTVYRVDSNHLGVRLSVLVALVAGFVGGIVGVPALFRLVGVEGPLVTFATLAGALGAGFGVSWLAEAILPRIWPSGRRLEVEGDRLILRGPRGEHTELDLSRPLDVWSWCFVISDRRAWVPRGWYCVALRLAQDGQVILPYTFASPDEAERLPAWEAFEELISERAFARPGQEHLTQFYAQQEHLRAAESERWRNGAEIRPGDFAALVDLLAARLDNWPAQGIPI